MESATAEFSEGSFAPRLFDDDDAEAEECARMMSTSEPWLTLGGTFDAALRMIRDPARETYLVHDDAGVSGFIVLDMRGTFAGYIQSICVRQDLRGRGLGSALLRAAERRIFASSPNVFLCVSSFNTGALRLYRRLGYEVVGTLSGFIVREHDEILLRKTGGPWAARRP